MVNVPVHGESASAAAQSCLALFASWPSTPEPSSRSDQPGSAGDVKSLAGVRVPSKITFVICGRSIASERACRRSLPSSPAKCASRSGMATFWKTAAGWLTARPSRSFSKVVIAASGIASSTSSVPDLRSAYAESSDA